MDIAGHVFTLTRELGRGNFGVVFEAALRSESGQVVAAVKLSKIDRAGGSFSVEQQVRQLLTECTVLYRLNDALPCHSADRVPKYLGHSVLPSTVNLAMAKAAGMPLDTWLHGTFQSKESTAATPEEPLPLGCGSRVDSLDFDGACGVVAKMLAQLSPVFSTLQGIAFHRDISAHNVMIDDAPCALGGSPDFTLIDFGLAVDAPNWLQNWREGDIGGDPRYWSPAHWLKLFFGPEVLEKDPGYAHIFVERLDHYSFGIVALELLFGLWGPAPEEISARQTLARARAEWQNYWRHALALRRAVSRYSEDAAALRRETVDTGLCTAFRTAHAALCTSLREVVAEGQSGCGNVLQMATGLIDPSSNLCWGSVSELSESGARASAGPSLGGREF